jgi:hypothetical protein
VEEAPLPVNPQADLEVASETQRSMQVIAYRLEQRGREMGLDPALAAELHAAGAADDTFRFLVGLDAMFAALDEKRRERGSFEAA